MPITEPQLCLMAQITQTYEATTFLTVEYVLAEADPLSLRP